MIEHKYLKLLYRFCKENNVANFLPKTFDEDIKKIKDKVPLEIISISSFYSINNNKESYYGNPYIIKSMQICDLDKHFDKSLSNKKFFFPESLICLLRCKSKYVSYELFNFEGIYKKWIKFIKNELIDDFIRFMNKIPLDDYLMPYKLEIMRFVEDTAPRSKEMFPESLDFLAKTIKKDYPDKFDRLYIYNCFSTLHKYWYNYLLKML